jgi:hypothetical protein
MNEMKWNSEPYYLRYLLVCRIVLVAVTGTVCELAEEQVVVAGLTRLNLQANTTTVPTS